MSAEPKFTPWTLPAAFEPMRVLRQWIVYQLHSPEGGKYKKRPIDFRTGKVPAKGEGGPEIWTDCATATTVAALLGAGYGVGFYFTGADPFWFLDIDGALQSDNTWSDLAKNLCAKFPGAVVEVSSSGRGLHVIGSGNAPPHGCKNTAQKIELYTADRWVALTGTGITGNVATDHTLALAALIAEYFPRAEGADDAEWTEEPHADWDGPSEDDELVRRMLAAKPSAGCVFGHKASVRDLWENNIAALARAFPSQSPGKDYDASSADLALANYCAFWSGGNCDRMARLMLQSALARPKWNRVDYFNGTILRAAKQKNYYKQRASIVPAGTEPLRMNADGVPLPPDAMPAASDAYLSRVDLTDKGNANLLIQLTGGNLRYVAETKQWLRWDGRRWQIDEHEVFVTGFAVEVARYYLLKAQKLDASGQAAGQGHELLRAEDFFKWAAKCRGKGAIDNMIALARKSEGVPISVTELDRKPYLLGVENGVVDLRTGELRESESREEYVTKRSPVRYEPAATAPRWESLIIEATGSPVPAERDAEGHVIPSTVGRFTPRPALASYIHKALGYSTTGETREQKLFVEIGEGSNGKGLIGEQVKAILGPYAVVLPAEALMATKHGADSERPTALAASLAGARFVVASESKVGQKLDVALIKAHTGDEEMTARRMRENPFTFKITHKLWLLTNVRPMIDHIDAAFKGRLHLVPFDRRWNRPGEFERDPALPEGDKGMKARLVTESEGVLAWLVRGAMLYYREGLTPPDEVIEKTREYVLEQDHFGRWLGTMRRCIPKLGTMAADLLNNFICWCANDGADPQPYANKTAFGRALGSKGIDSIDVVQGRKWGLRTNTTNDTTNTTPIPPPPKHMP
jgi:P4 family phage/plasmid primase-like protien